MERIHKKLIFCLLIMIIVMSFSGSLIALAEDEIDGFVDDVVMHFVPFNRISSYEQNPPVHYYSWTTPYGLIIYSNSTTCDDSIEMAIFYANFLENTIGSELGSNRKLDYIYITDESNGSTLGQFTLIFNGNYLYDDIYDVEMIRGYIEIFDADAPGADVQYTLTHEYGHYFTFYHLFNSDLTDGMNYNNATGELMLDECTYGRMRGIDDYAGLNEDYLSQAGEILTDDYISMFGSPDVKSNNFAGWVNNTLLQRNTDIYLGSDYDETRAYWMHHAGLNESDVPPMPTRPALTFYNTTINGANVTIDFSWTQAVDRLDANVEYYLRGVKDDSIFAYIDLAHTDDNMGRAAQYTIPVSEIDDWEFWIVAINDSNVPIRSQPSISVNTYSNDANMSNIELSDGELSPNFNPNTLSYTASVPNSISSINIEGIKNQADATILGDGNKNLNIGENSFDIIVTAQDGTTEKTYTIVVTRQSNDSSLSSLSISKGELSPNFNPNTLSYTVNVSMGIISITITATTSGGAVLSGDLGEQSLVRGDNTFNLHVTAEDGVTKKSYTIVITRQTPSIQPPQSTTRLWGNNRYTTSAAISQEGWEDNSVNAVLLALGTNFPDALASSPLAYALDSPVLLCDGEKVSDEILAEIQRLNADKVILLGGLKAQTNSVTDQLESAGLIVTRIAGDNRNETALKIGQELRKVIKTNTVVISTGQNFPDALTIGPFAARNSWPILFANGNSMPAETLQALNSWGITDVYIVGGYSAIGANVQDTIEALGISVTRLWGDNRYETALNIIKHFDKTKDFSGFCIATGEKFPDALAGSILAARANMPILLCGENGLPSNILAYIKQSGHSAHYMLGGSSSVSSYVEMQLNEYLSFRKTQK